MIMDIGAQIKVFPLPRQRGVSVGKRRQGVQYRECLQFIAHGTSSKMVRVPKLPPAIICQLKRDHGMHGVREIKISIIINTVHLLPPSMFMVSALSLGIVHTKHTN